MYHHKRGVTGICDVDGCGKRWSKRRWCATHYSRFLKYGDPLGFGWRTAPVEVRFWSKVEQQSGCWLWTGAITRDGYGHFGINHRPVLAHKWLWEYLNGPVSDGLELDHLCRVRHCVLPGHLEPVTHATNMARSASGNCRGGHPLVSGNVYQQGKRRRCRRCMLDAQRRSQQRKKG